MKDWRKTQCCGTCKHWDLKAAQFKNGAVPKDAWVMCRVEIPEVIIPASVRLDWGGFKQPQPDRMPRDRGSGCPFYERRINAVEAE